MTWHFIIAGASVSQAEEGSKLLYESARSPVAWIFVMAIVLTVVWLSGKK